MSNSPDGSDDSASEAASTSRASGLTRRGLIGGAAGATGAAILAGSGSGAASASSRDGTVSDAPNVPRGFTSTFKDRFVEANGIRQHIAIGGNGPPLLLVHGWPESWYAWRLMMPALAAHHTVIAVDQRGIGLTDHTPDGYDTRTLANDMAALMEALGYARYAIVGHDTGYAICYALAADHRQHVARAVLAEIPGPPGVGEHPLGPPFFVPAADNNRLWHIAFNRVDDELIVNMVRDNAQAFYAYEFAIQGSVPPLPDNAIRYYVRLYTRSRSTLRASFGLYRAWEQTVKQNMERAIVPLTLPILGIGGALSYGSAPATELGKAATDVQSAIIPGVGHWVAEQAPDQMVATITEFLAPYRNGG